MAINPIAVHPLDYPANPKPVPLDFSPLAGIGQSIGNYVKRQQFSDALSKAVNPDGSLDLNRAATIYAMFGENPAALLQAVTARETAKALAGYRADELGLRRQEVEQGKTTRGVVTEEGPKGDVHRAYEIGPKGFRWLPEVAPPATAPAPAAPAATPPAATPGPSSSLPIQPNVAEANPEEAAPYRVAGPPMPPPTAAAASTAAPTAAPTAADTEITPSLKKTRQELATKAVDLQAEQVKDAKAAAEIQPLLDDVTNTWQRLTQFQRFGGVHTGTGFLAGSDVARLPQKILGTEEEKLRQAYDQALYQLRARVTAAMNKGQGAVSNYERQLYSAIFPSVTTVNPTGDLAMLQQMRQAGAQTARLGRETTLGKEVPGLTAERPAIERPQQSSFDEQTLGTYRAKPTAALGQAQRLLAAGVDRQRVRGLLMQVDPTGELARKSGL